MAKTDPANFIVAVRPAGKKNCQWFVKVDKSFQRANVKTAMQTLRDLGLKIAEAQAILDEKKANAFTEVTETKSGNLKFA